MVAPPLSHEESAGLNSRDLRLPLKLSGAQIRTIELLGPKESDQILYCLIFYKIMSPEFLWTTNINMGR